MSERIKNYLGITIILVLIIFALAALKYVGVYSSSVKQRSFSVSAEGKAVTIPDIAQFSATVITEGGNDLAKLQEINTQKANAIVDFLTSKGIDKKDIQTQNYKVQPRYQYSNCATAVCPPAQIVGYTITQSLLVKVRDTKKAGDLLGGVVQKGANSVSQLTFTIDDKTKFENEARAQAIQKAKEKARAIAQAGSLEIGKLISIDESSPNQPQPYAVGVRGASADAKMLPPVPEIQPGSQEVHITVTLTYEIE